MLTENKYFLFNGISEEFYETTEAEFFEVIGYDRTIIPMKHDTDNINKRSFFSNGELIGYCIRATKEA